MDMSAKLTLPTDSKERKEYPLLSGCLKYFPAALAGIARISKVGNDKHNPGLPLHHARGLSMDHGDCVLRHLVDTEDLLAAHSRADSTGAAPDLRQQILLEASQMAWRALAYSQMLHERFGAPLAPGADERLLKNSSAAPSELGTEENIKRAAAVVATWPQWKKDNMANAFFEANAFLEKSSDKFRELVERYSSEDHKVGDQCFKLCSSESVPCDCRTEKALQTMVSESERLGLYDYSKLQDANETSMSEGLNNYAKADHKIP